MRDSDTRRRKAGAKHGGRMLLTLGVLAALAVVFAPGGSASPPASGVKQFDACLQVVSTSSPECTQPLSAGDTSMPAGSTVGVSLTIYNDSSNQAIGSADLTAPAGFSFDLSGVAPSWLGAGSTSTVLELRNLNIAPGGNGTYQFSVTTGCSGGTWGLEVKQSNDFSGPPGNDFGANATTGLTTDITGGCNLAWKVEPQSTNTGSLITGTAFDTTGPYVAVAAVPAGCTTVDSGSCAPLTSVNGVTVTLTQHLGTTVSGGTDGGFTGTTATLNDGVATFNNLTGANPGYGYTLVANGPAGSGFNQSPDSNPFELGSGEACTTSGCPSFTTTLDKNGTNVQASGQGSDFGFLAVLPSLPYPSDVTAYGGGCAYWQGLGAAGFDAYDQASSSGDILYFTYLLPWSLVKANPNNGVSQPPICARTTTGGWTSRVLNPDGSYSNTLGTAVQGSDGFYYGILPLSPQDHVSANNPQILSWQRVNRVGDYYTISAGYPWDIGMRG